ncbi:DUF2794 domain-containing protein [Arsenicitalea aurantiaca]|uniref:DUF2794 domain-containing protein n=1 Tax=Arsenicitalea aurantiaca TaxID=1783274 RepID=A0A433X7J9_9HYPH|nr:DUF2794 domain-containing protein [Arsenicitalea aurantiaca]RUT30023.1 DUF2794 domain-containing protein [Arsenicitalea aurantiaca]
MADTPSQHRPGQVVAFGPGLRTGGTQARAQATVSFDRNELTTILNLYGRKVANGEWRDYAMDFLRERALFSIYKRNSERPLFVIEKNPRLRNRQGQYMVTNQDGRIVRRGHDLATVLRVLDPQLEIVR